MYSFGNKLKELRTKRGLSQDELADRLNERFNATINKGMISKWENDIVEPRLDVARMLALFFNVSLDELLGIKDDIQTIAAHFDGDNDDWTEEELREIEEFKQYVRMRRSMRENNEE